jgi:HAD superfamily hydrolase (TIGR01459 family)
MTRVIQGLGEVASRYDLLLCDVWGVVHNGREAFAGPCAAAGRWRRERGPVILISNSPRPSSDVIPQLDALGVPRGAWSALVTSGDATRVLLAARAPGPAWAIGPERDAVLYEGLDLSFSGPQAAAFITCTGLVDDETETPEDYRKVLSLAALRGLPMICANPDRVVQRGEKLVYCGGALADLYQTLGGKAVMAGKPHAPIYEASLAEAGRRLGRPVDRTRILAVGDGLATDVAGANAQGLDILFVASGIHGAETTQPGGGFDAGLADAVLAKAGAHAAYTMGELAW